MTKRAKKDDDTTHRASSENLLVLAVWVDGSESGIIPDPLDKGVERQ